MQTIIDLSCLHISFQTIVFSCFSNCMKDKDDYGYSKKNLPTQLRSKLQYYFRKGLQ